MGKAKIKKFFQTKMDEDLIDAVRIIAMQQRMTVKDYLNDFLKRYLLQHAKTIGDENLIGSLKQKLDNVEYHRNEKQNP